MSLIEEEVDKVAAKIKAALGDLPGVTFTLDCYVRHSQGRTQQAHFRASLWLANTFEIKLTSAGEDLDKYAMYCREQALHYLDKAGELGKERKP